MPRLGVNALTNGIEFTLLADSGEEIVLGLRSLSEPREMLIVKRGFEQINSLVERALDKVWVPTNSSVVRYHSDKNCSIAKQRRVPEDRVPVSRYDAVMLGLEECGVCNGEGSREDPPNPRGGS